MTSKNNSTLQEDSNDWPRPYPLYIPEDEFNEDLVTEACRIFKKYINIANSQEFQELLAIQNERWEEPYYLDPMDDATPFSTVQWSYPNGIYPAYNKNSAQKLWYHQDPPRTYVQLGSYPLQDSIPLHPCYRKDSDIFDSLLYPRSLNVVDNMPLSMPDRKNWLEALQDAQPIFRYPCNVYSISLSFDILFTALEKIFNYLPDEPSRISQELENSCYIPPAFLRSELSSILQFFPYRKETNEDNLRAKNDSY